MIDLSHGDVVLGDVEFVGNTVQGGVLLHYFDRPRPPCFACGKSDEGNLVGFSLVNLDFAGSYTVDQVTVTHRLVGNDFVPVAEPTEPVTE